MADRRDQIRMSDNELWTFVGSAAHLQVATLNLAPMLHQGAPPLCVSLLSSGREMSVSGSLGSVHFVTASRLPGRWLGNAGLALGLRPRDSYGYLLGSSPASNATYPSSSPRVLGAP